MLDRSSGFSAAIRLLFASLFNMYYNPNELNKYLYFLLFHSVMLHLLPRVKIYHIISYHITYIHIYNTPIPLEKPAPSSFHQTLWRDPLGNGSTKNAWNDKPPSSHLMSQRTFPQLARFAHEIGAGVLFLREFAQVPALALPRYAKARHPSWH